MFVVEHMITFTGNAIIANNSAGVRKFPHVAAMHSQDGLSVLTQLRGALSFLSCISKWEADHLPHAFTTHTMNVGGGYSPESNRISKGKWSIANPRSLYSMTSEPQAHVVSSFTATWQYPSTYMLSKAVFLL